MSVQVCKIFSRPFQGSRYSLTCSAGGRKWNCPYSISLSFFFHLVLLSSFNALYLIPFFHLVLLSSFNALYLIPSFHLVLLSSFNALYLIPFFHLVLLSSFNALYLIPFFHLVLLSSFNALYLHLFSFHICNLFSLPCSPSTSSPPSLTLPLLPFISSPSLLSHHPFLPCFLLHCFSVTIHFFFTISHLYLSHHPFLPLHLSHCSSHHPFLSHRLSNHPFLPHHLSHCLSALSLSLG